MNLETIYKSEIKDVVLDMKRQMNTIRKQEEIGENFWRKEIIRITATLLQCGEIGSGKKG